MCGCNFPPSQFQLHLQFFLMPWLPSHYKAFTAGVSLSHRRWFPLEYIKGLLGLNQPMAVELDTSLDEIFAVFDAQLSYDNAFEQEVARSSSSSMASSSLAVTHDPWYTYDAACEHQIARVAASHKALANWRPADFAAALDGDAVVHGAPLHPPQRVRPASVPPPEPPAVSPLQPSDAPLSQKLPLQLPLPPLASHAVPAAPDPYGTFLRSPASLSPLAPPLP